MTFGGRVGELLAKHDQHFVEGREAELLVALAPLLRLGADEAGALREFAGWTRRSIAAGRARAAMSLTLTPTPALQQLEDLTRTGEDKPAQHVGPLLGIDHQKIARHDGSAEQIRPSRICIRFS